MGPPSFGPSFCCLVLKGVDHQKKRGHFGFQVYITAYCNPYINWIV